MSHLPGILQFIFLHYGFIALACLTCFIIGARLTVRVRYNSMIERFTISTALGMGLIALLIFLLGLVKGLYGRVLVPILLIILVAAIASWPGLFKQKIEINRVKDFYKRIKGTAAIWTALLALIVLFTLTLPLYPPTAWDATSYHFAVAKMYSQDHAIVFTPFLRYPVAPQLGQMLFVAAFVIYDDVSAQLMVYAMFILIACGLYSLSRRYFSSWAGILSSAIWLGSPYAVLLGSVGYIDIGLTLFCFIGIYAFINYYQTNESSWLWLCGIFLGFAAAVKYPALLFVLLCGLIALWMAFTRRDYLIPVKLSLAVLVAAAPFYIRNYVYSGNPFFPYLSNFFTQRIWNVADVIQLAREQGSYGLPKTLLSLLTLPWHLIFDAGIFRPQSGGIVLSPAYLLAFPAILVMLFVRKTRLVGLFGTLFSLFWFYTPQIMRYLLPALPLLALAAAIAFEYLVRRGISYLAGRKRAIPSMQIPSQVLYSILAFVLLIPSLKYTVETQIASGYLPVTPGERAHYLQRKLPSYSAYRTLNGQLGNEYTIYALEDENMAYFAGGAFMGDWFGPGRFSQVLDKLSDDSSLYAYLRQLKANYFLINEQRVGQVPEELLASPYFQVVDRSATYVVFKLADAP